MPAHKISAAKRKPSSLKARRGGRNNQVNVPYNALNTCQQSKFVTYIPPSSRGNVQQWLDLDDSQRVEFAGGTQALETIPSKVVPCNGLGYVKLVDVIAGKIDNAPSADQFHIGLNWKKEADDYFKSLDGWSPHISWLHPGQYGYQENRDGNPFLGIVTLFDQNDPTVGQFHIGFRTLFGHYFPDNGNIAANYKRYRQWYGPISGYTPGSLRAKEYKWAANKRASESGPTDDIRSTVRDFLAKWYIEQDIDGLVRFVAHDNAARWLASLELIPSGTVISWWTKLFDTAFKDGVGTVKFKEIRQAITYPPSRRSKSLPHFKYRNDYATDRFAVINRESWLNGVFFPSTDFPTDKLDPPSRFLRYVHDQYVRANDENNRLHIVVYLTTGNGLIKEACVLYWVLEESHWKLAAFQGTD